MCKLQKNIIFDRWHVVNDFEPIRVLNGSKPYPERGLFFFYERMSPMESDPISLRDSNYLPPAVRIRPKTAPKMPKPSQVIQDEGEEQKTTEELIAELKEIHADGLANLNCNLSNKTNLTPDNPALKKGVTMFQNLKERYKRSDPCVICNESWFVDICLVAFAAVI